MNKERAIEIAHMREDIENQERFRYGSLTQWHWGAIEINGDWAIELYWRHRNGHKLQSQIFKSEEELSRYLKDS